jgi:hypothetical protein
MSENVKYIPSMAFYNCTSLTDFTWNAEEQKIEGNAFEGCSIKSFDFSKAHGISKGAFKESQIEEAKIGKPEYFTEEKIGIGAQSFMSCSELETVALGGNVDEVGSQAFAECENLETVIIPDSVTTLEDNVFSRCCGLIDSHSTLFHRCNILEKFYVFLGDKPDRLLRFGVLSHMLTRLVDTLGSHPNLTFAVVVEPHTLNRIEESPTLEELGHIGLGNITNQLTETTHSLLVAHCTAIGIVTDCVVDCGIELGHTLNLGEVEVQLPQRHNL